MKLLLDIHLLLWAAGSPDRLPAAARQLLEDPLTELLFSAASLWEIVIKRGLGRSDFQVDARVLRRGLLDNGYQELAITVKQKGTILYSTAPKVRSAYPSGLTELSWIGSPSGEPAR
jgi:PIN domain nuclease of toxin-antitoxin system